MFEGARRSAAVFATVGAALILGSTAALAYTSGSVGYDIGYLQCGTTSTTAMPKAPASIVPRAHGVVTLKAPAVLVRAGRAQTAWWSVPPQPPSGGSPGTRTWWSGQKLRFGIFGVDSGYPFMSALHPGNPCLASQYGQAPSPGLYVNTGYDPTYTDATHTTTDCATQSAGVAGSTDQKKAWAVGCSEAQGDYGYAGSKGITSPTGWWLDVETANSWCGEPGTSCTDLSLNQYTLQGLIDTLTHIGAVPIGIYSTGPQWRAIVGTRPVTGATSDWVASGTSSVEQAATYCSPAYSFSGDPVSLVQFFSGSADHDYAC